MNFWLIGLKVIGAKMEKIENVLGLSTDDISHVIITPIQDYTIGRINLFKKAISLKRVGLATLLILLLNHF